MKIAANIAIPAMSPTTIPTIVLVLKPVLEDAFELFDELLERDESAVLGMAAIAGGDVGEEMLGSVEAEEGIKHKLSNGFPQSCEFPAKDLSF